MELEKHSVREIMSILDTVQRETVIKLFPVLISTNIAARGIFISSIFFGLR
jgi:ABC-type transport system involved in Fe-S cluster assembly fused permease/ATPase subunit